ncbi:MAG: hypothetical protein NTZ49_05950 [Candidatus Parcubacteria bacterium]|nr:hypothetical protein [Candidatus Parcubacteria bacterium]
MAEESGESFFSETFFNKQYPLTIVGYIKAIFKYFAVSAGNKILATDHIRKCIHVAAGYQADRIKEMVENAPDNDSFTILMENRLVSQEEK